jgi:replicative DNA helicase
MKGNEARLKLEKTAKTGETMNREEAKQYINANPQIYFKKAKQGYICPLCRNGSGKNGTGITKIPNNKGHYKCFKCNESGDVLHFIGKEYNLTNFKDILDKGIQLYGISIDNKSFIKGNATMNIRNTDTQYTYTQQIDYTNYCNEAAKHLNECDYLTKRGISIETQKRFNIGYVKEWKHPDNKNNYKSERIIIPTSANSYIARATTDTTNKKFLKAGEAHLFNIEALRNNKSEPIFIAEGEIDALSIIEAGGQAIGLGGVNNIELLKAEIDTNKTTQPIILCLDNDTAGETANQKIADYLIQKGIPFTNSSKDILGTYKDPNELLTANRQTLKDKISEIKVSAGEIIKEEKENYKTEKLARFRTTLKYFEKKREAIPTGFKELDTFLNDGLYAGLYIIGAASGAGKTTFILQIADQIATQKKDVFFFSGEMSAPEIIAKSLSRLNNNTLTAREIMNYQKSDCKKTIQSIIELYKKDILQNIDIFDGRKSITDIKEAIEKHKRMTGNYPIVFIDYLQALKFEIGKDLKQQVDNAISELRIITAKYEIPIFIISSLNREAYKFDKKSSNSEEAADEKYIDFAAFKESGSIEYGADVLMTLKAKKDSENETNKSRVLELRIIKNRLGKTHRRQTPALLFEFFYMTNSFKEKKAAEETKEKMTNNEPKYR